ncbi:MAG: hypothetical protein DRP61_02845 [Candidatus Omnitrophota bacterium]|nr:MAG: hypothetical protein DRP61_02845 [Candidatus Omnitrophota bacterium]
MKRKFFIFCWVVGVIYLTNLEAIPVEIRENKKGGFQLFVKGKPFLVKGVIYHPIPPGKDFTHNFWQDLESIREDAKLIKQAGFNTVRFYEPCLDLEQAKKVIRAFYEEGIYTIMGHWLGFWNYPCPFYGDENFQDKVKEDVLKMVESLRREEGLLCWVLGNENNYSFSGKVNGWTFPEVEKLKSPQERMNKKAEIYYGFVNEIAKAIKEIDKDHPVGLGNGELITLDIASQKAKAIDFLALIFYRGKKFGNIFNSLKHIFNKPVLISETGCDAYDAYRKREDQDIQAKFLLSQWIDLYKNSTFFEKGGNCLGGVIFEWSDEWWKHNPSDSPLWGYHDTLGGWSNGAYYFDIKAPRNLNMNEEWFGIVAWEKTNEGFKKKPRKAYYILKEFFQNPANFLNND